MRYTDGHDHVRRIRAVLDPTLVATDVIGTGDRWQRPDRCTKTPSGNISGRFFADTRVTAFRLAA
jgi:hypothetical protein